MNNDTKQASDDLDKLPGETNTGDPLTPAEEAAKRLGLEDFSYTERS